MIRLDRHPLADAFDRTPRTIRVFCEDDILVVDVVPAVLSSKPTLADVSDPLFRLYAGSREIVQSDRVLRLRFDWVCGHIVVGEDHPHPASWSKSVYDALKMDRSAWPLMIVTGSPWRSALPNYRGGENDEIKHFVIGSEVIVVDVLAALRSSTWLPNTVTTMNGWYEDIGDH